MNKEELYNQIIKISNEITKLQDTLNNLKSKLYNLELPERSSKIIEISDKLFSLDTSASIILLGMRVGSEDGDRTLIVLDDGYKNMYDSIEWEWYKYNKWAIPVNPIFIEDCNGNYINEYDYLLEALVDDIPDLYNDNDSSVNCYWYGIVALTRNHDLIYFVCRDDGMMSDDCEDNYTQNHIIKHYELNN